MHIKSLNNKDLKIAFNPDIDVVLLGDVIKIVDKQNKGVIAQVFHIENNPENNAENLALARIILTVFENGKWINWQGNTPSASFDISRVQPGEILGFINQEKADSYINLGNFSYYPKNNFIVNTQKFDQPTLILCEKQQEKLVLVNTLANELAKSGQKVILLDFIGEYSFLQEPVRLVAGKNFKLPLNIRGIQSLYEKTLFNVSPETKAIIEDVFVNVQEFIRSSKEGFVPFSAFKSVVDEECQRAGMAELVLLKNSLDKLAKEGTFANNPLEFDALKHCIETNNFIIIDFTKVLPIWHKEFINLIIDSNIENYKKLFYFMFELRGNNVDEQLIDKLYIQGYKSGIRPIVLTGYNLKFTGNLMSVAKNFILYHPRLNTPPIPQFGVYLSKLNDSEALVLGNLTNNVPLFIKPGTSKNQNEEIITEQKPAQAKIQQNINKKAIIPPKAPANNLQSGRTQLNLELEAGEEDPEPPIIKQAPEPEVIEEIDPEEIEEYENFEYDDFDYAEKQPQNPVQKNKTYLQDDSFGDDYDEEVNHVKPQANSPAFSYEEAEEDFGGFDDDEDFDPEEAVNMDSTGDIMPDFSDFMFDDDEEDEEDEANLPTPNIPVYSTEQDAGQAGLKFREGDRVQHQKYGKGVINKIIGYGNKKLCSIQFEKVGRRLLDPELAALERAS